MRYKIVACILILSAFTFVLAAPVPVREIREACADAVEGDEDVIIVSGKRAPAPRGVDWNSDTPEWAPSSSQTPPVPDGSHPGVDMPSSPSAGSTSPPSSTPGRIEAEGAFKPGTTTGNQPASPSKLKSVSWGHTTKVHFYGPEPLLPPPGREGYLAKVAPSPETEHISPNYFSPKPQSKGFTSKLKTFFSKLGKLIFFTRL